MHTVDREPCRLEFDAFCCLSTTAQVPGCQESLGTARYCIKGAVCPYHYKAQSVLLSPGGPPHRWCYQVRFRATRLEMRAAAYYAEGGGGSAIEGQALIMVAVARGI